MACLDYMLCLKQGRDACNVADKRILKEICTWSPALGPSALNRMGLQRLSSFIKLEFWKWAISAALPCMRAYASDATFSLLNFSHFFPLNTCQNCTIRFNLWVKGLSMCGQTCWEWVIIILTTFFVANLIEWYNQAGISHVDECISNIAFVLQLMLIPYE